MQALQDRFEDPTAAQHAKARICSLRQGKRPVAEYIQDFCSLVAHLRDWPEHMLVYQFQEGLNKELYHNCLPWGVHRNLRALYQLATNVELNLMVYQECAAHENRPHRMPKGCPASRGGKDGALPATGEKPCWTLGACF
ncbi:sugar phosphate exchanger 3 [Crotalus adamanteus]|uniref:Sugar phosphate exchanger 3 n=1 Tax=Crotalus adamanteus TaxID=8729 RepID=A0AAW1B0Z0_CROAD